MRYAEMIALALALSVDAFAAAVCKGACLAGQKDRGGGLAIAVSFGFFQALMPLIGWLLGSRFRVYIESVDHYIAFGLLAFIGGKLVFEAVKNNGEELVCTPLHFVELLLLSIATSVDALAAGVALAVLDTSIWLAVAHIGVITLVLGFAGFVIGKRFGARLYTKAQLTGGIALVGIGIKILVEHLIA